MSPRTSLLLSRMASGLSRSLMPTTRQKPYKKLSSGLHRKRSASKIPSSPHQLTNLLLPVLYCPDVPVLVWSLGQMAQRRRLILTRQGLIGAQDMVHLSCAACTALLLHARVFRTTSVLLTGLFRQTRPIYLRIGARYGKNTAIFIIEMAAVTRYSSGRSIRKALGKIPRLLIHWVLSQQQSSLWRMGTSLDLALMTRISGVCQ